LKYYLSYFPLTGLPTHPKRRSHTIRTIEQCVSSHQWLQEGFKDDGEFESAQAIVSQLMEDIKEIKPKKAVIGDNSSWPLAIE
jgi:hypothetical protein